ncbi:pentatricopeptide repeat-containing protein At5g02830, chloroplastic [Apium graveolens]|uniref:pentatricopeptide repeat-containing protein At5g02830, chloroplastic n=1 Tax=Apium graveolens TaxID=4045 RepID=UPI003D7BD909
MNNTLLLISCSSIITPPNPPNKPSISPKLKPSSKPLLSPFRRDLSRYGNQNSLKYYADLASRLVEAEKMDEFMLIAETVVNSGVEVAEFVRLIDVGVVSKGVTGLVKCGERERVFEVLECVKKLGVSGVEVFDWSVREAVRKECRLGVEKGDVEGVVEFLEMLSGFDFSVKEVVDPAEIIKICVATRKPNVAVRCARIFPTAQILFCSIILEFGKKGDIMSAMDVFEASKKDMDRPNMYIYRTIIDVCGLCGDYLRSRSIYEDLLSQNITPNIYVFNSLMNVNARDLSYTLHIYKHMQTVGVAADVTSYNILLKSCCRASRVDLAQNIYREVQNLESNGVLKLDVFTYSTIIKAFADAKMWQMALEIKEDMLTAGVTPNTITWSSLINAVSSAGLVEQSILLFEEMLLAGCTPNTQCCNTVLHACIEACQYDRAFRLFSNWKRSATDKFYSKDYQRKIDRGKDHSRKSYNMTGKDYGSDSDHVQFTRRVPFKPTTATYNILMKACGTDHKRAKALMHEMKALGLSPNQISWSILIDIFGASRNVKGAMQILSSMRQAGIQPDVIAYTAAMKVCVQNQNLQFAFSLFERMKRDQIQPNLVTYNTLLKARTRYGSLEEVRQCLYIYQDMRKAGYSSNDYYLKQLIEEWCEGILQGSNQNQVQNTSSSRTELGGSQSLLLEKVAANLQKTGPEILAVDLRGLTKVEARIVVLAVLRMIKENYTPGNSLKDDMSIILGVQEVVSSDAKHDSVKDAIVKLLQDDLGLEVIFSATGSMSLNSDADFKNTIAVGFPTQLESPTRRPSDLHRLKVMRKSLFNWLQKRLDASTG